MARTRNESKIASQQNAVFFWLRQHVVSTKKLLRRIAAERVLLEMTRNGWIKARPCPHPLLLSENTEKHDIYITILTPEGLKESKKPERQGKYPEYDLQRYKWAELTHDLMLQAYLLERAGEFQAGRQSIAAAAYKARKRPKRQQWQCWHYDSLIKTAPDELMAIEVERYEKDTEKQNQFLSKVAAYIQANKTNCLTIVCATDSLANFWKTRIEAQFERQIYPGERWEPTAADPKIQKITTRERRRIFVEVYSGGELRAALGVARTAADAAGGSPTKRPPQLRSDIAKIINAAQKGDEEAARKFFAEAREKTEIAAIERFKATIEQDKHLKVRHAQRRAREAEAELEAVEADRLEIERLKDDLAEYKQKSALRKIMLHFAEKYIQAKGLTNEYIAAHEYETARDLPIDIKHLHTLLGWIGASAYAIIYDDD